MKNYIPNSTKPKQLKRLINEALDILESVGIPVGASETRLTRMAECFLAVAGVTKNWTTAKSVADKRILRTRDIIGFINKNFDENISSGSYDDIRRKDLILLVLSDLVLNISEKENAATNDPTRGYGLLPEFRDLLVNYGTLNWDEKLTSFNSNKPSLSDSLARKRNIDKIPVRLPDGKDLEFSYGEHNLLQKKIIEEFLPRFGSDCEVLYVGDTSKKILHIEKEALGKLNFFELSHEELPDVIAYSNKNNWLYLIEAVHSAGPMSEIRVHELKKLLKDTSASLIFVTAFLTRKDFHKWAPQIAWGSEVWIAESPTRMIHFDGHKFLGPNEN
jgi:hypothetical protein